MASVNMMTAMMLSSTFQNTGLDINTDAALAPKPIALNQSTLPTAALAEQRPIAKSDSLDDAPRPVFQAQFRFLKAKPPHKRKRPGISRACSTLLPCFRLDLHGTGSCPSSALTPP